MQHQTPVARSQDNASAPFSDSSWQPEPFSPGFGHSSTGAQGEAQFSVDDSFADSSFQSSMIADFPFEMNFGNASSLAMAPATQVQGSSGNEKEDFSTPFLGIMDLEWLNELLPQDDRILHMG